MGWIGLYFHAEVTTNSWKKLIMLSDRFEVSTSNFDLFTPGDFYHSTKRATVQPNHSKIM
jgi:hypothetical protein